MNRALLCVLAGCAIAAIRTPVQAQGGGIKVSRCGGSPIDRYEHRDPIG
jgi:hypothetical protein